MTDRLPLSDLDTGWLAGFYEGEGCVIFGRRVLPSEGRKWSRGAFLKLQFTQKDLEPLFHVKILVAGHGKAGLSTVGKGRDCYVLSYTNQTVILILATIMPWLSRRRQAQAQKALDAYAARRTRAQFAEWTRRHPNSGQFIKRII